MSYRQDLKRLRRAQRQARHQQHQLATAELNGIVGVILLTLQGTVLLPVSTAAVGTELTDVLHQSLVERQRQLDLAIRRVQQDWYESEAGFAPPADSTT